MASSNFPFMSSKHPSESAISQARNVEAADSCARAKRALRVELRARRARLAAAAAPDVPDAAARSLMRALAAMPVTTLAGYWPMGDEFDARPAMNAAAAQGWSCALPVVTGRDAPLVFRCWHPGDELEAGGFGTSVPRLTRGEILPDIVLVPLLGFDATGLRLGYGGGYYDRTLAQLRARGGIRAIGLAFAGQEVTIVPADGFDQRLDWIITEGGLRRFAEERA